MKTVITATALLVALTTFPVLAEPSATKKYPKGGVQTKENTPERPGGTEVDFVDSSEGYWLNRGLNDTIYGANGSYNSVRLERNQVRSGEALNKIYKPPTVVEVTVNGKVLRSPTPPLKIDGKVVESKRTP